VVASEWVKRIGVGWTASLQLNDCRQSEPPHVCCVCAVSSVRGGQYGGRVVMKRVKAPRLVVIQLTTIIRCLMNGIIPFNARSGRLPHE
jgi:hypothetical protein